MTNAPAPALDALGVPRALNLSALARAALSVCWSAVAPLLDELDREHLRAALVRAAYRAAKATPAGDVTDAA